MFSLTYKKCQSNIFKSCSWNTCLKQTRHVYEYMRPMTIRKQSPYNLRWPHPGVNADFLVIWPIGLLRTDMSRGIYKRNQHLALEENIIGHIYVSSLIQFLLLLEHSSRTQRKPKVTFQHLLPCLPLSIYLRSLYRSLYPDSNEVGLFRSPFLESRTRIFLGSQLLLLNGC